MKALIERAAAMEGKTASEFVHEAAARFAEQRLTAHETPKLNTQARAAFLGALEHPPEPSARLRDEYKRYPKQGKSFHNSGYRGFIPPRTLQWLANDLKFVPQEKLVLVATHIPLLTFALDDAGNSQGQRINLNTVNLKEFLQVLEGRDNVYTISGHDTSNSSQVYIDHEHGWSGARALHHQVLAGVRGDA